MAEAIPRIYRDQMEGDQVVRYVPARYARSNNNFVLARRPSNRRADYTYVATQDELIRLLGTGDYYVRMVRQDGTSDAPTLIAPQRLTIPELHQDQDDPPPLGADDGDHVVEEGDEGEPVGDDVPVPPDHVEFTSTRYVRDTAISEEVKRIHNWTCQICGETVIVANGRRYAEGHHVRPLNAGGLDIQANILCLCPNHHVACDYGGIRLELGLLRRSPQHQISQESIDYHNTSVWHGGPAAE